MAEKTFDILKKAFIMAPILSHFDPSCLMILKVDASNFALCHGGDEDRGLQGCEELN